jgi:site-specific recombinase XerD
LKTEDYLVHERFLDAEQMESPALFLPAANNANASRRVQPKVVNRIWNEVRDMAGVEDKTPHSGRHGMGRHLIEKTKNIAAVQRPLGHKNAAYSMPYMRITAEELQDALDER